MRLLSKLINKIIKIVTNLNNSVAQDEQNEINSVEIDDQIKQIARTAASEGAVLLKNNGVLPLKENDVVSVFGRNQYDYFYTGYGSGGDVKVPYTVNIIDGLKNANIRLNEALDATYRAWIKKNPVDEGFWGHWPRSHKEMKLTDEIVKKAKESSDVACVCIGRSSGEDRENALEKGSFYLQDSEIDMLDKVTARFDKVVVLLNIGSIMDFSFVEKYKDKISAILIVWQGGMESGNAVADLLTGKANPSGRLTDTIAKDYYDYPSAYNFGNKDYNNYSEDIYVGYKYFETFNKEAVLYPFGYGLSYTKFIKELISAEEVENGFIFKIKITNVGAFKGKDVVELYVEKPQTKLGNSAREFVGYKKTKVIEVGASDIVTITVPLYYMTSYDDCGITPYKSSFVLEEGVYNFYMGDNVRAAKLIYSFKQIESELFRECSEVLRPKEKFEILCPLYENKKAKLSTRPVSLSTTSLKGIILNNLPKEIPQNSKNYNLKDVKDGKITLDEFIGSLTIFELEALSRGDFTMNSKLGPLGNAGALGGVIESLRKKGVIALTTTDGPSGIRLAATSSLIPIGTLLACTYNEELVEELYSKISSEMQVRGTHILLAPGMNIHRNPLCGRNFEYYSEDAHLTGTIAAAAVRGIQSTGRAACPKHFAANSQEFNRTRNDSRMSERALREVYLKAFEICLNMSEPLCIMTSYNKINGVWNHYNYELCQTVLRDEWGYEGLVMTDWWMQYAKSPEFKNVKDQAYRVRSRVNVFMPGAKRIARKQDLSLIESYTESGITLAEMQQSAKDVLQVVLKFI